MKAQKKIRGGLVAALLFALSVVPAQAAQSGADQVKQADLMGAIRNGDTATVKSILSDKSFHPEFHGTNCDPNTMCNIMTYAVDERGNVDIVRALHDAGAPIDEQDGGTGDTPLIRSLLAGHVDIAEYLVQQGADPLKTNKFGVAAYSVALGEGSPELLEAMLKAGAPVNFRQTLPDLMERQTANDKEIHTVGDITPLMVTAGFGRLDMIEVLLKHGANPDLVDKKGRNVYSYAMFGRKPDIKPELEKLIAKYPPKK